jgi:hypothetical protein
VDGPRRGDLKWAHLPEDDLEGIKVLIRTGVVALVREGTPMHKVVPEESDPNATSGLAANLSLLDEIVRDGGRQMLAAALQAEVVARAD